MVFNENCFAKYNSKKQIDYFERPQAFYCVNSKSSWFSPIFSSKETVSKVCTAPTHQQVVDWFREKHYKHIHIKLTEEGKFIGMGVDDLLALKVLGEIEITKEYKNYYEALNEALNEAIELIQK
ncbi:MAG: hypothetical protein IPJ01_10160 [Micavibrio sp.]|nr:hypothetical protein [Micavibrio sp.]